MSLYDRLKAKKKISVRRLIGADSIEDCCLVNYSGEKIAFLILTPVNLSILPDTEVRGKVKRLTAVLEEIGTSDYLCINSTQSYEHNKHYISNLESSEHNKVLHELDRKDIQFLDDIQVKMATSRQFLVALHLTAKDSIEHVEYVMNKASQIFKDNHFTVRIATKNDIKRCLAINLEQDIYEDADQDFDGENYLNILEMKK